MKKKIILLIAIFFSINFVNADVYNNPRFNIIRDFVNTNISNSSNPYIFPDMENAILFCLALGQNLVSYSENNVSSSNKKAYFNSIDDKWKKTGTSYRKKISEIECSTPIDTSSSGTYMLNELNIYNPLYNGDLEIMEYTPTLTGNVLIANYQGSFNDVNKNLYEIKYILLISLLFCLILGFYFLIEKLIGKN